MADFNEIINDSTRPTLVDFYATWCVPCKMQAPVLEEVKKALGDKANVVKVDVDKNQAVAASYHVQSIPTLLLFVGGEVVWRVSGFQQAGELVAKVKEYCK